MEGSSAARRRSAYTSFMLVAVEVLARVWRAFQRAARVSAAVGAGEALLREGGGEGDMLVVVV